MEQTLETIKYLISDNIISIVFVNYLLIEALKQTKKINKDYLAITSLITGLLISVLFGYLNNSLNLYENILIGLLAGGFTSGAYSSIKSFKLLTSKPESEDSEDTKK